GQEGILRFGSRRRRNEKHAPVDGSEFCLPLPAASAIFHMRQNFGRELAAAGRGQHRLLCVFALHDFGSPIAGRNAGGNSSGASVCSTFWRALKTRQRAVSSVTRSTAANCLNDIPSSTRNKNAARNSGCNWPTALARWPRASRLSVSSM